MRHFAPDVAGRSRLFVSLNDALCRDYQNVRYARAKFIRSFYAAASAAWAYDRPELVNVSY
jgi:hypothetical protein